MNRCSSGIDRSRQEWLSEKCDDRGINTTDKCPIIDNKNNNGNKTNDKMNINSESGTIVDKDDRNDYHHNEIQQNTYGTSYSKAS